MRPAARVSYLEAVIMRRGLAILALVTVAAIGCNEADQNRIVVRVTTMNEGAPVFADVIAINPADSTAYIPTDLTPVEFTNRPYSSSIVDPGNFSLDFQLQRYVVRWRAVEGTPGGIDLDSFTHTEATSFIVPFNGTATLGASIVAVGMKTAPPFASLQVGGEIPLIAEIDFIGASAVEPDDEIVVTASVSVIFANYGDSDIDD
jgi:hypothetical protein